MLRRLHRGAVAVTFAFGLWLSAPAWAGPAEIATLPKPAAPTLTPIPCGIELGWDLIPGATEYNLYSSYPEDCSAPVLLQANLTGTSWVHTPIPQGSRWSYFLVARAPNDMSPLGDCATGVAGGGLPLEPPTAPVLGAACTGVSVSWPIDECAGLHEVWRSSGSDCSGAVLVGSSWSGGFSDTQPGPGISFSYHLRVTDGVDWSGPGGCATVAFDGSLPLPAAPAVAQICNGFQVSWNPVPCATGYDLERSPGSSCAGPSTTLTTSGLDWTDASVLLDETWSYRVRARNAFGPGPWSGCTSRTFAPPSPPIGLTTSDLCTGVQLSWASIPCGTLYEIQRAPASDCAAAVAIWSGAATSWLDTSATPGEPYLYRVRGWNGSAWSSPSPCVSGQPPAFGVPSTPEVSVACTTLGLAWPAVPCATSYQVERSSTGDCADAVTIASSVTTTSFRDPNLLDPGTSYAYRIRAARGSTITAPSGCAVGSPGSFPAIPAPTLYAQCGAIRVSWPWLSCTLNWEVSRSAEGECDAAVIRGTTTGTSFLDTGVQAGTLYRYRIRAWDGARWSDPGPCASIKYDPLVAPAAPTISPGCPGVTVTCPTVPCATQYEVNRYDGGSCLGSPTWTALSTTTTVADGSIPVGTTVSYRIRGLTPSGWTAPGACTAYLFDVQPTPAAPTVEDTCGGFEVSWPPVSCATTYQVQRLTGTSCDGTASSMSTTSATTFRDTSVVDGMTYSYRIRAMGGSLDSTGPCTTRLFTFVPPPPPDPPTLSSACTGIRVSVAPFLCATQFLVRRTDGTDCSNGANVGTIFTSSGSGGSWIDTGVTPGGTYTYQVAARLGNNWTAAGTCTTATFVSQISPPEAPVPSPICSGVRLDWPAVSCASRYEVFRAAGSSCDDAVKIGSVWGTAYFDETAKIGATSAYRVEAINSFGERAAGACRATEVTGIPPSIPSGSPYFYLTCDGLHVSWGWSSCVREFELWRSTAPDCSSPVLVGVTPYSGLTDSTAPPGVAHWYTVRARNETGVSPFGTCASAGVAGRPPTTSISGISSDCGRVRLSWSPIACATSYDLYRSSVAGCGSMTLLGTIPGTTYEDTPPTEIATAWYRVVPRNAAGLASPVTSCVPVAILQASASPAAPSLSFACGTVVLDWPDPFCPSEWRVERADGYCSGSWAIVGTTQESDFSDRPPSTGTWGYRLVRTLPQSSAIGTCSSISVTSLPLPPAPTLSPLGCSTVQLSWSSAPPVFTTFDVERSAGADCAFPVTVATGLSGGSFIDEDLPPGSTWSYRLVGKCNSPGVAGPCSSTTLPSTIAAPSDLRPQPLVCGKVNLAWSPVSGASGYRVAVSPGGACHPAVTGAFVAANRLALDSLPPGGSWSASVTAVDLGGCESAPSSCLTFSTSPEPAPPAVIVDACGAPVVSWPTDPAVSSWVVSRVPGVDCAVARFREPAAVSREAGGTFLVADRGNATIRRVGADRSVVTVAGSAGLRGASDGPPTVARFVDPTDLDTAPPGGAIVYDGCRLRLLDGAGTVTTVAGRDGDCRTVDGAAGIGRVAAGSGVAFAPTGSAWFAETSSSTIRRYSATKGISTVAGSAGIVGAEDGVGPLARFSAPRGLAATPEGWIAVADTGNHTIRRVDPDGTVTTLAGRAGEPGFVDGPAGEARFSAPSAIEREADGGLLVVDSGNGAIRRLTVGGTVETLVEGLPGGSDAPEAPGGHRITLAPEEDGTFRLADSGSHAVVRWAPGSGFTPFAGLVGGPGSADGAAADLLGETSATSWVDEGVGPGSWSYLVVPRDGCGLRSTGGCAPVSLAAPPPQLGNTLFLRREGTGMSLTWADVAGASSYDVRSDVTPTGPFATLEVNSPSGAPGATIPLPTGDRWYKVVPRAPCAAPGFAPRTSDGSSSTAVRIAPQGPENGESR